MSIEHSIPDGIDETQTDVKLSPEAMNLAHEIAIRENELRSLGRSTERITQKRGREFGSKIARLAIRDPSAAFIYRPIPQESGESDAPTHIAEWAKRTYGMNLALSGVGGERDLAFKD